MTTITILRDDEGHLVGATDKDRRAYAAFTKQLTELTPGEMLTISVWFPRNPRLHRLHFAMLNELLQQQEQFEDIDHFRKWLSIGAEHCEFMPGPKGKMIAIPLSISWDELDDAGFQEYHEKVVAFLRSKYATRLLWPTMSDSDAATRMADLLSEFGGSA